MTDVLDKVFRGTLHIDRESIPWVWTTPGIGDERPGGTQLRVLHYLPEEEVVVSQVRAQPFAQSRLHRHLGWAMGFTTEGAWGHDKEYKYQPGVYIYEQPGLVHQFLNGPEVSEVYFISQGLIEFVDPDAHEKVIGTLSSADVVREYYASCDAAGISRPKHL